MNRQELEYILNLLAKVVSVTDLQGRVVYDKIVEMHKKEVENEKNNSVDAD